MFPPPVFSQDFLDALCAFLATATKHITGSDGSSSDVALVSIASSVTFSEKLFDLANVAAAALVFGQFADEQPLSWLVIVTGARQSRNRVA